MRIGHRVHQPGERGLLVHANARADQGRHRQRTRAASDHAHLSVPVVLVHGQRNIISAEAVLDRDRQ